jgi:hypothetical protein
MFSLSNSLQLNFNDLSILNAKPIYFGFSNVQSQMGIIAGEMIHQLLNSQLKRMQVEVDIFRGSMTSTWITQENIDRLVERSKAVVYQ